MNINKIGKVLGAAKLINSCCVICNKKFNKKCDVGIITNFSLNDGNWIEVGPIKRSNNTADCAVVCHADCMLKIVGQIHAPTHNTYGNQYYELYTDDSHNQELNCYVCKHDFEKDNILNESLGIILYYGEFVSVFQYPKSTMIDWCSYRRIFCFKCFEIISGMGWTEFLRAFNPYVAKTEKNKTRGRKKSF